jgi:drug/metabolite transporter (DMT)-like permease
VDESTKKGVFAILLSAIGFAFMGMFVRLADDFGSPISPFQKSFFRNVVAFVVAAFLFIGKPPSTLSKIKGSWGLLFLRAFCGTVGIFGNFYALSHIPIADAMALNKTSPFFTVVFSWMFFKQPLSIKQALTIASAFIGALFIIKPDFSNPSILPAICGLLGGVGAGGAYACLHALGRRGVDGKFIVLFFSAASSLATIPFLIFDYQPMTISQIAILIAAGVSATIGQFGITAAYRYAQPRNIVAFDYTGIVFSAILGYIAFGQFLDAYSFIGVIVIVVTGLLLRR